MMADKSIRTGTDTNGKPHYRAQLIADTAAELAGVTEVGGVALDFGSIAHAVDDAQILRLDSSGDWIIQTGDDAGKTPAEVASSKAAVTKTAEYSEETEGDDAEPLEPVEKFVETVDTETKKAVNADDKSE